MKKYLYLLAVSLSSVAANAQGTVGLIAHWNLNGNANDISGNGLNGVVNGATLATGYSGTSNTAYLFSGLNASNDYQNITVPYDPLMNVTSYSICALVKVDSFHRGLCQESRIFGRGTQGNDDYYALYYNDNTYDDNCFAFTPTKMSFLADLGNEAYALSALSRGYPYYIDQDEWYCVVTTFDGDSIKTYIDGMLQNALYFPYQLMSGTEDIRIGAAYGFNIHAGATYPYPVYGLIDDIKLYGRALSLAEVGMYCEEAKSGGGDNPGDGGNGGGGTDWPTSVNSIADQPGFVVAPNPAGAQVQVFLQNSTGGKVQLLNTMGQVLAEKNIAGASLQFDLNGYASGMYMIRMQSADGKVSAVKFLKQ